MLVLRRRLDEKILIGDDICVAVLALPPGRVSLGVTAPLDVPVWRDELERPDCRPATPADLLADAERLCLRMYAAMTPLPSGLPHPLADAYRTAQILVRQLAGAAGEKARAS